MRVERPAWFNRFDQMFGDLDSRLKVPVREVFGTPSPLLNPQIWEPIFCWNCGADGGHVTKDTPIRYICQKCHSAFGALPLPMVPGTEDL
jgi:hypothetical protein